MENFARTARKARLALPLLNELHLGKLSETVIVHGNTPHNRPRFLVSHNSGPYEIDQVHCDVMMRDLSPAATALAAAPTGRQTAAKRRKTPRNAQDSCAKSASEQEPQR